MSSRSREIITINIGGCGVNLGQSTLKQHCVEQGISPHGNKDRNTLHDDSVSVSFQETSTGTYRARSIFIDLDPLPIHCLQNMFEYSRVIQAKYTVHGKISTSCNWADGHLIAGKEIISDVCDALRLATEQCDNLQGFVLNHSIAGGTGGGFTSFLLERMQLDYRKKIKLTYSVLPHENRWAALQIYAALLTLSWCLQFADVCVMLDNYQMHEQICKQLLGINTPRFKHLNNVYAKYISNITAACRFGLNQTLQSVAQDMVPLPRLHFLTSSMSPLLPSESNKKEEKETEHEAERKESELQQLTAACLQWSHFTHSRSDFDVEQDKYLAMSFVYRGSDIKENVLQIKEAVQWSCKQSTVRLAPAMSSNIPSVKVVNSALAALDGDCVHVNEKASVSLIANNVCVLRDFQQRVMRRKDILYDSIRGAFIFHLIGFAFEEGEVWEASDALHECISDYMNFICGKDGNI